MTVIFCKLSHEVSLQARGSRIRFFSDGGTFDHNLHSAVVGAAVNLYEGVAHLLTTNGVYEVRVDAEVGMKIRHLGPEL
ncbi:hypothetical protein AX761_24350 [Rhizobium sp. 58]|nr:hypothetical protein AX761_24350 [Rhizobium sp. 58]